MSRKKVTNRTKRAIPNPKRFQEKYNSRTKEIPEPDFREVNQEPELITPFAVIYEPTRDGKSQNHLQRYTRPVNYDSVAAGAEPEISLQGTWLKPGRNHISVEEWEYIQSQPEFKQQQRKGVFAVIEGIPTDNPTGTLEDYEEEDAIELAENTYDLEELKLEVARERRVNVIKACREQIQAIEDQMNDSASLVIDE